MTERAERRLNKLVFLTIIGFSKQLRLRRWRFFKQVFKETYHNISEYANCLSDNGKFREALNVLIDILDERHEARAAKTESGCDSPQEFSLTRGGGAKLCSAPVLCAQDIADLEEEDEADVMTHKAFMHYISALVQVG